MIIQPRLLKPFTHDYAEIDREMIYLSIYSVYRRKNIPIILGELGISERGYASLLDLPVVDITGNTLEEYWNTIVDFRGFDANMTSIISAVSNSQDGFYLLKNINEFFFTRLRDYHMGKNSFILIENFIKFYRKNKLTNLFADNH